MSQSATRRYLPAVVVGVLVLVTSLVPLPETGDQLPRVVGVGLDKWAHATGYGALAGLLARARRVETVAGVLAVAGLAAGYGAGIELLQGLTATRTPSVADAVANAAGSLVGTTVWLVLVRE